MSNVSSQSALIIDGLSLSATVDDLRDMLAPYGSVVWCRIAVDRLGNSLRYGYVMMDTEENASEALQALTGKMFAGLPITVALAEAPGLPRLA
ncbi:RNA recognition motif domain-containing protein [Nitrospira sp. Nam74]